jgi:hypothetical protein
MKEIAQSVSMQGRKVQDSGVKSDSGILSPHQDRSVSTTYGEILTRELLIGEPEEGNYFKCY